MNSVILRHSIQIILINPMVTIPEFYYQNKDESSHYSQKPPGYLNVERLIKNQAPWKKFSLNKELKQKALILTDWRAELWSRETLANIKYVLKQLIQDGFALYVWQDGNILPLNEEALYTLDKKTCRKKITPVSHQILMDVALKQHQLSGKKIHLLDDYWIDTLLSIDEKNPLRKLSIRELNASSHKEGILSLLKQSTPPLKHIIHDEYSTAAHQQVQQLQAKFPDARVSIRYCAIQSDERFKLTNTFDFPEIHPSDFSNIQSYRYIVDACFIRNIPADDLYRLLSSLPALRSLELTYFLLKDHFNYPLILQHLEELVINLHDTSSDHLQWLLSIAPHVKKLMFKTAGPLYTLDTLDFSKFPWPDLEDLNLYCHGLRVDQINAILSEKPLLKKLKFTNSHLSDYSGLLCPNMKNLEELEIAHSPPQIALAILEKTPNLKTLNLDFLDSIPSLTTPILHLDHLETLRFTGSHESEPSLSTILSTPKHLDSICLTKIEKLSLDDANKEALATVEHLDISECTITGIELHDLLLATPNLKTLVLSDNDCLSAFDADDLSLTHLETFDINQSNIATSEFLTIISNARSLKKLGIHWYDLPELPEILPSLDRLETLDLSDLSLNTDNFKKLLLNARNIKRLDLEDTELSDQEETDYVLPNTVSLKKLEKLILVGTCISDQNIEILSQYLPEAEEEATPTVSKEHYISKPIGVEKKLTLNGNTTFNPDKVFEVKRYFTSLYAELPDPMVNNYRMQVFNHLEINSNPCSINDAFFLKNETEARLVPCQPTMTKSLEQTGQALASLSSPGQYSLGRQTLVLSNDWQALASLSAHDILTHVQVDSDTDSLDIAFAYSERDNLYYVRTQGNTQEVSISFLLNNPRTNSVTTPIPQAITVLVDELRGYTPGELIIDKSDPTGEDFLKCFMQQKIGSCRHRVLVFKRRMEELFPEIPVRLIINECHAFAEIQLEGIWRGIELGGYPSKLNIHEPVPRDDDCASADTEEESSSKNASSVNPYLKALQTWNKKSPLFASVSTYCETLLQSESPKKQLIELTSSTDVAALQLNFQQYCQSTSRPCFYIHSPDDLVCSASFIKRELGSLYGVSTRGPGGALHDFLTQAPVPSNPPVLIVNYDHFDNDDILRFNALLDNQRSADGTPLPTETFVIGLINTNKTDCYQGADFYSRFDKTEECPFSYSQLNETLLPLPLRKKTDEDKETTPINLFHANDWQERLLGYWSIQGDTLIHMPGQLEAALAKGLPIELQNAPWDDADFMLFWQQACLHQTITHDNHIIPIPSTLQLLQREGYHWQTLTSHMKYSVGLIPEALTLNPGNLGEFFLRYHCDNEQKKLYSLPGHIEAHAGNSMEINVTQNLNEDEWAMVLDACEKNRVTLHLHLAKSVTLPATMIGESQEPPLPTPLSLWDGAISHPTTLIKSTDIEHTVAEVTRLDSEWLVIDVTECERDDLLTQIHHEYQETTGKLVFKKTNRILLNALSENKKIILKGAFSPTLIDALAPILLERQFHAGAQGQLLLLSSTEPFHFLTTFEQTVTPEAKRDALIKRFSMAEVDALPESLLTESFSRLQARLMYLRSHPEAPSSDLAWEGLQSLPSKILLKDFNPLESATLSRVFYEQRGFALNQRLLHAPYVFITGLTAVGKTSFVEKFFTTASDRLYQGKASLKQWAEDNTPQQRKILFIDEANLSPSHWSAFEGLFNHPPSILMDGQYYPLSDQHKVIFAGNPVNYSDDRKLAPFFSEHGNALVFTPLPLEFIFEEILKPVFEHSRLSPLVLKICEPILEVYRFFCEHAEDTILISPRELQFIALLVHSYAYHQLASSELTVEAAYYYAYSVAVNLLPEQYRFDFDKKFDKTKELPHLITTHASAMHENFLTTSSRQLILQQLDDFLTLQEFKGEEPSAEDFFALTGMRSTFPVPNPVQRYGGLGGLILEGEPGIGKSELVIAALHASGYQKMLDYQDTTNKMRVEKPYYYMPASLQMEDKKRLLLKAFHEGAIVVCDEINSSPMMERFLNQLLMGKTPDDFPVGSPGGQPPRKLGFLILGTQNPPSNQGRYSPSLALARRLLTLSVPPYEHDEMIAILRSKGVDAEHSELLVSAYEENCKRANRQHLNPKPTFRDLLQVAANPLEIPSAEVPVPMVMDDSLATKKRQTSDTPLACPPCKHTRYLEGIAFKHHANRDATLLDSILEHGMFGDKRENMKRHESSHKRQRDDLTPSA